MRDVRHDFSITAFQQKRGGDAAAFFVPFLAPGMTLLDVGCGPGTITAALAGVAGTAIRTRCISDAGANARAQAVIRRSHASMRTIPYGLNLKSSSRY